MPSATGVSGSGGLVQALALAPGRRPGNAPGCFGAGDQAGAGAKRITLRRRRWCWRLCATVAVAALFIVVNGPDIFGSGHLGAGAWAKVAVDIAAAWLTVHVAAGGLSPHRGCREGRAGRQRRSRW